MSIGQYIEFQILEEVLGKAECWESQSIGIIKKEENYTWSYTRIRKEQAVWLSVLV